MEVSVAFRRMVAETVVTFGSSATPDPTGGTGAPGFELPESLSDGLGDLGGFGASLVELESRSLPLVLPLELRNGSFGSTGCGALVAAGASSGSSSESSSESSGVCVFNCSRASARSASRRIHCGIFFSCLVPQGNP